MLNKFCVVLVVMSSIVAGICIVCLSGCNEAASGSQLRVDVTMLMLKPTASYCMDGWVVYKIQDDDVIELVYAHEHDVQEHLVSCKEIPQ